MAESKIERFIRTVPKPLKPESNPVIRAILEAWSKGHDDIVTQIQNTKAQIFVRTAQGQYLDKLGSGLGVSRPPPLGMTDTNFQEFIPVFSNEAKNIRKSFYNAMDIFWGPLFSRANVTSLNFEPFSVAIGDSIQFSIDGGISQTLVARIGDIATPGAATAAELAAIFNRGTGCTASTITDRATGKIYVNLRTNTPGGRGSVQFLASSMLSPLKINFETKKFRVTDLNQRTVLWEVRQKEIVIELPAILPSLRRTLKGSHHWHATSALEAPQITGKIWKGSFLYSRNGASSFTVSKSRCQILEQINAGSVVTKVTVNDASQIPNNPANVIFGFGMPDQEQPVKILSRPNNSTLLIDPSHTFTKTHPVGTSINILSALQPPQPRITGNDYSIYLTSPSSSRALVQSLLQTLAAAGVVVTFVVLLPSYPYLTKNPYSGT